MSEIEIRRPTAVETPPEGLLLKSRPAILFVTFVFGAVAILALATLVYQLGYRLPTGEVYWRTDYAWINLLGLLVKGLGLAAVTGLLRRYDRAIVAFGRGESPSSRDLFVAHRNLWTGVAVFVAVLAVYAIGTMTYLFYLTVQRIS